MSLRHPRVVTVFGLCELNARPYLVRELTAMGSLPDVLYGGTCKLSPADIALILRDVCEGLLFLHSTVPTPIVHGALKPQNIFIEESWRAKVAFSGKAFSRADPLSGDDMHQAPEVRAGQVRFSLGGHTPRTNEWIPLHAARTPGPARYRPRRLWRGWCLEATKMKR